jgi:hypothetical protein
MNTVLPLSHGASSHHDDGGFIGSLVRGFGWHLGGDAANLVFHMLPVGLVIVLIVAVAGFLLVRWARRRR